MSSSGINAVVMDRQSYEITEQVRRDQKYSLYLKDGEKYAPMPIGTVVQIFAGPAITTYRLHSNAQGLNILIPPDAQEYITVKVARPDQPAGQPELEAHLATDASPSKPPRIITPHDSTDIPEEAECMTPLEWENFLQLNEDRKYYADEFVRRSESSIKALPLKVDCDLVKAARLHSQNMARQVFFSHVDPSGKTSNERIRAQTGAFSMTGENIWQTQLRLVGRNGAEVPGTPDMQPAKQNAPLLGEANLMKSPGHRHNILQPPCTHVGVGIAWNESTHTITLTQDFGGESN